MKKILLALGIVLIHYFLMAYGDTLSTEAEVGG